MFERSDVDGHCEIFADAVMSFKVQTGDQEFASFT